MLWTAVDKNNIHRLLRVCLRFKNSNHAEAEALLKEETSFKVYSLKGAIDEQVLLFKTFNTEQ